MAEVKRRYDFTPNKWLVGNVLFSLSIIFSLFNAMPPQGPSCTATYNFLEPFLFSNECLEPSGIME